MESTPLRSTKTTGTVTDTDKKPWIPARYVMTMLGFLGFFNLYALRVNLSVAIVAMVDNSEKPADTAVALADSDTCPTMNASSADGKKIATGEFTWDSQLQGIILGSFFYGYIFTQLAGAVIAKRFGPKHPFGLSALLSGILALLIPVAAKWHVGALIATRVAQGFFQGVCFPSMHTMISLWAPPLERSKMVAISYSGMHVGTVTALILSGIFAEAWGWESIFYVFGTSACVWYFFWLFLVYDSPDTHPRISKAERLFITSSIGRPKITEDNPQPAVPWKKVFTSLPVLAICVGHFGNNWGFYTLLTNLPTYFNKILHFNLKENGVLSALPYIALAILMPVCGVAADALRRNHIMTTTTVRKVFHFSGQLIPAVCLVAVGYIGCDVVGAVALLVVSIGCTALALSGFQVNHIDVSPTFAGTLMGLSNTLGTVPGIVGPYVAGWLTSGAGGQTISQWRIVFYVSAGVYLVTAIFYVIFASGEPAKWDRKKTDKSLEEHE